jgi:hypothetical protein
MFKVVGQLTNVRSPKSTEPIVETSSTPGTIKLNAPACEVIGVNNKDYVAVVKGKMNEDAEEAIYIVKGHKTDDGQFGSKLASAGDKAGGSLGFSSENAYKALDGSKDSKKQYTIGDGIKHDGSTYFELVFKQEVEKTVRKPKATAKA